VSHIFDKLNISAHCVVSQHVHCRNTRGFQHMAAQGKVSTPVLAGLPNIEKY